MTFGQFLSILRARKWVALLVFALVVTTSVVVSLMLPKQYTATASVMIDVKPDPVSIMSNAAMAMPSFMATQVDIMSSDRVTLRVVRDLKLAENPALREQWQTDGKGVGTFEQYLSGVLQKGLDVKPSRESNVIAINYKSPEPRFAAGLANAYAQAYIATTLELRADPNQSFRKLFEGQTEAAKAAVERAQAKLSAFQKANGIVASDERLDIENLRLNELNSQLTQLQAVSAESANRQLQAQGAQGDRLQEVLNNPVIGGLKTDLARNEARLQELSARFGDNHPQVIETKASIAELRARVEAETRRVAGGVGVSNTINKGREAQIQRELAAQRAKVLSLKAQRDEGTVLQRELDSAQRIYDNLAARQSQTALESQNTQSYASLLTGAQAPLEASSPRVLINTMLSVFGGTLLAVGIAFALELSDRRVRAVDDIVTALGLPVLGTLPLPSAKRFVAGNRPAALGALPQAPVLPAPAGYRAEA